MKYFYIFLLCTLSLNAQLLTPTMTPQTLGGLRQFSQSMSGRANYNNRGGFNQTVIPNRMMPYAAGIQNQQRPQQRPQQTLNQNQQQPQVTQPLRAHNNKYPVNKFSTMGFGGYKRINLRDSKAQALAAQRYKTTLATLRISLRGYRMNFNKPTTPPNNNNNNNNNNNGSTTPQPPQPPTTPPTTPGNNGNGQVGIGGGPGPVPPTFPGGPGGPGRPGGPGPVPPTFPGGPDNPDPSIPVPQPRPAVQPPIPAVGMPAPQTLQNK
jgi:hypothetical protein